MNANGAMRMPLLDFAFHLMDSARSPQDFTLILHLRDAPEAERFYSGAKSAMNRFPKSASCIDGRRWVWRENKYFKLKIVSDCDTRAAIETFIDDPFDLRHQPPVRQMLILNGPGRMSVVTRFHHSAADGLSAALWLGHQLNVVYGLEEPTLERAPFVELPLRNLPTAVRRSEFAFQGASDRLWTSNIQGSGKRRWITISFPASDLQRACRRASGFSYNDLLATCTLEVLLRWNWCRGGTAWPPFPSPCDAGGPATECGPNKYFPGPRIGLWMPMNVRREAAAGFGNGTSRIRLYARYNTNASLVEKCREVRRQVSWTSNHGEWVVPEMRWFTRMPRSIAGPLLRRYLHLPSVDMATAVFSHAGSWIANAGDAFKHVERIESVGLLHPRQSIAVNAATHRGQTWLSLTYDPQSLCAGEAEILAQMYEQQIALAREELL